MVNSLMELSKSFLDLKSENYSCEACCRRSDVVVQKRRKVGLEKWGWRVLYADCIVAEGRKRARGPKNLISLSKIALWGRILMSFKDYSGKYYIGSKCRHTIDSMRISL